MKLIRAMIVFLMILSMFSFAACKAKPVDEPKDETKTEEVVEQESVETISVQEVN